MHDPVDREFHVARSARDLYQFDQALFGLRGNVVFADFHAARLFAQKINDRRDLVRYPERAVRAGQINAMGLIDEILHLVVRLYRDQKNAAVLADALEHLERSVGREPLDRLLLRFVREFPPLPVYRGELSVEEYLAGQTGNAPHRQAVLEELVLLWLANANPAFSPFLELFDDDVLEKEAYPRVVEALHEFFAGQPPFGPQEQNLLAMLRSPAVQVPHSLTGQLEYIRSRWGYLLGDYLYRLLSSLDFIREEQRSAFLGAGPSQVYEYGHLEAEAERFSPDKEWMPRVVMMAKNAYVWLDQLSRRYGRPLSRLDQVPDEELDSLGRWGFTGLWLIGVWERSRASRRIKQLCGNPDAVASAYSLYDYRIADDLGGEEAFHRLKERAWQRGIRMAGDMVPNHMGIDSHWVAEHPDWFVSLDYSPFPSYSFGGPDLSEEPVMAIHLEEHYYDRTDAAVVFRRTDRAAGGARYIYHGNDGTSMPWNDTAQLNFLLPEVREAVIRTILDTARRFPIIRFDAAMTLTKKHYQRLWFPEPGTGGDIPSRAEHGMSREELDRRMPQEFWREVVDRVAREAPDTLLLAEAFWLLEGYFVRTLGMHRVYNSAFMNMLKNEENSQYRSVMKNTLEFDPQILKRFVNFMNNPDEETAVAQFGKGDKYFGVCTMMVTLPGLPMFGHGQVEGLTEKYGMEYRRAYWDEQPDGFLVERHQREIFPLIRRRYLFAEVDNFLLYDFFSPEGTVNEDVFAYSNSSGEERALVVYNNRYDGARGWIRTSTASLERSGDGRRLVQRSLGEGLALKREEGWFTVFREQRSGLQFLRRSGDLHERGLFVELPAYGCQVFLELREVQDDRWGQYAQLEAYLDGRGVPDLDQARREVFLQPLHAPLRELAGSGMIRRVTAARLLEPGQVLEEKLLSEVEGRLTEVLRQLKRLSAGAEEEAALARRVRSELEALLRLPAGANGRRAGGRQLSAVVSFLAQESPWPELYHWLLVHALGAIAGREGFAQRSRSWIDEWLLGKVLGSALQEHGLSPEESWSEVAWLKVLTTHQRWFDDARQVAAAPAPGARAGRRREAGLERIAPPSPARVLETLLRDAELQSVLGVNRYQGELWFNAEAFQRLVLWLEILAVVEASARPEAEPEAAAALKARLEVAAALGRAAERSGYRVERLLEAAGEEGAR